MPTRLTAEERSAVVVAFDTMQRAGGSRVDCYRAGVEALQRLWPRTPKSRAAIIAVATVAEHLGLDHVAP
jgi:hypothetical protein